MDLGQFEASDPVAGVVRADLGHELREGEGGHRRGGQARTQDGQGPRLQQIRPDVQELGEEPVELMGDQDLESGRLRQGGRRLPAAAGTA